MCLEYLEKPNDHIPKGALWFAEIIYGCYLVLSPGKRHKTTKVS